MGSMCGDSRLPPYSLLLCSLHLGVAESVLDIFGSGKPKLCFLSLLYTHFIIYYYFGNVGVQAPEVLYFLIIML